MNKKRIIIDTDPGIDDALAIILAVASPEFIIEGLTIVHGNSSLEQGTRNALSILELIGAEEIPVSMGYSLPLVQPSLLAPETHGNSGLGYAQLPAPVTKPTDIHAVDFIIETIYKHPNEITLFPIGPLTNIAMAIRKDPNIVKLVKEIIIMGGAINAQGNTTPLAEFNVYVDPHAAHIVFHSGAPITLIPLDVSYQCIFSQSDSDYLANLNSPITKLITDATRFYMEFHDEYQSIDGCVINDPLVLALGFAPDLVELSDMYVDVDISGGVSMGKTFADIYKMTGNSANVKVALQVNPESFIKMFIERVEGFVLSRNDNLKN